MTTYPPGMTLRPLEGWPTAHTSPRRDAPFRAKFTDTLKLLDQELRNLEPEQPHYPKSVLQLALRERDFRVSDGMPRADSRPSHPGVILSIEPRGDLAPMSFPCDTFWDWQDNLRAIALGMEALRKVNRYGITQTGQQYRGWQAIEAKPAAPQYTADQAEQFLRDVARAADPSDPALNIGTLQQLHRRAVAVAHPDRNNGRRSIWDALEVAVEALRAAGRLR